MSYSTKNLTTRELESRMIVRFDYHSESKSVQSWMEYREDMVTMDEHKFYRYGYHAQAVAIENALNDRLGRRWWGNHG